MTAATQSVAEIALEQPMAIRVFERYGIEYCCGGRMSLAKACELKDVAVERVMAALEAASCTAIAGRRNWGKETLADLADHIVATHHTYCKSELVLLSGLAIKVTKRHGGRDPELSMIRAKFAQLAETLTEHLAHEEISIFPMIVKLERDRTTSGTAAPEHPTIASGSLARLMEEHEDAGALMAEIRILSRNFNPPGYACATFRAFYEGLREFEQDLHQHVHLENNILFPRAAKLEVGS